MQDAAILFEWRNDPATRAASITPVLVEWEGHLAWLDAVIADQARDLQIALCPGPVGSIRFDGGHSVAPELSWTVAPNHRGRGIGQAMVTAAVAMMVRPLVARIRNNNVGSQKIARAAGFALRTDGDVQIWEYPRVG